MKEFHESDIESVVNLAATNNHYGYLAKMKNDLIISVLYDPTTNTPIKASYCFPNEKCHYLPQESVDQYYQLLRKYYIDQHCIFSHNGVLK